jgi:hypothetical protein
MTWHFLIARWWIFYCSCSRWVGITNGGSISTCEDKWPRAGLCQVSPQVREDTAKTANGPWLDLCRRLSLLDSICRGPEGCAFYLARGFWLALSKDNFCRVPRCLSLSKHKDTRGKRPIFCSVISAGDSIFLFLIGDPISFHMKPIHLIKHIWAILACHVS